MARGEQEQIVNCPKCQLSMALNLDGTLPWHRGAKNAWDDVDKCVMTGEPYIAPHKAGAAGDKSIRGRKAA